MPSKEKNNNPEDKNNDAKPNYNANSNDKKDEKKPEDKPKPKPKKEEKPLDDNARTALFINRLKTFSGMYKINVNQNDLAYSISEAWTFMKGEDEQKKADGKKEMAEQFKKILQMAFDVEKKTSYEEHRMPEFNEIIKSTNELFRTAMFAFTDLYHDPKSEPLFAATSYAGLDAKDMAELTAGESLWKMDQTSDKAWEIQSREAKDIADQWLKEDNPYEKMINEMNAMIKTAQYKYINLKEVCAKLTAAEWLLVNNEKMMVDNPEDPINPIPNWGNRYWKSIIAAREELGISKYTSMRDIIQKNYSDIARAAVSTHYNEQQIKQFVLDPKVRAKNDSLDAQKEVFTTQARDVVIKEVPKEADDINELDEVKRLRLYIESEDQRKIMQGEPKVFSNRIVNKDNVNEIDKKREIV